MNKEVCWGVGGGQESCGKKYGGCGGRCREMCWGVGGGKERCVGSGEVWGGCGRVYGVSGEVCRRVGKGCGEGNGRDVGKCVEVWDPNTLFIPHISLPHLSLHFPLPPPHSITLSYTSSHTSSHISPSFPHTPDTFSYYSYISLHDLKVWRSYHVAKLLETVRSKADETFIGSVYFIGIQLPLIYQVRISLLYIIA